MRKIPSLFKRDFTGNPRLVVNEIEEGCEPFITDSRPTRKWDGTACMVKEGKLFVRYDCKKGKTPPSDFVPCQQPDIITGHWPGWIPAEGNAAAKWAMDAFKGESDGTYELCGPKINGNPEKLERHILIRHGLERVRLLPPFTFEVVKDFLASEPIEGIVFYLPSPVSVDEAIMCKIKRSDFGFKWPV